MNFQKTAKSHFLKKWIFINLFKIKQFAGRSRVHKALSSGKSHA